MRPFVAEDRHLGPDHAACARSRRLYRGSDIDAGRHAARAAWHGGDGKRSCSAFNRLVWRPMYAYSSRRLQAVRREVVESVFFFAKKKPKNFWTRYGPALRPNGAHSATKKFFGPFLQKRTRFPCSTKEALRMDAVTDPLLQVRSIKQAYHKDASSDFIVLDNVDVAIKHRRDRRSARPFRLRQEHASAHSCRPAAADRGRSDLARPEALPALPRAWRWCFRASRCFLG